MTDTDSFSVPLHLAHKLMKHTELSKRLEIGENDLTPIEVSKLKKRKLQLRTAIAHSSYRTDTGPRITDSVLHPLSIDTMQILERRLKNELDNMKTQVGPTSPDLKKVESLLLRVSARLGKNSVLGNPGGFAKAA